MAGTSEAQPGCQLWPGGVLLCTQDTGAHHRMWATVPESHGHELVRHSECAHYIELRPNTSLGGRDLGLKLAAYYGVTLEEPFNLHSPQSPHL